MEHVRRLRDCVKRIVALEKDHTWQSCSSYPPGRCPICFQIRVIEQDEIEKEITILEEQVMDALENEQNATSALRKLVEGDIARCHRSGKWPYSEAELAETNMIEIMLTHRLELRRIYSHAPLRFKIARTELALLYQKLYREVSSTYWSTQQIAQYPEQTPFVQGFEYVELV